MKTIFSKYSTNRRAEKATMTYFTEQDGKTLVRKLPATPAAKEHLEQMAKNYTALQQAVVPQVSVASCWWEGEALVFEKAEGITWLEKLLTVYESGGFEAALAEFKTFRDFLYSCMKTYEPYRFTPEGRETFGVIDLEGKKCMCPANVDLLPANVILDKKGGITIIDYEWVYPFPVPVEYILYRSIGGYYSIDTSNQGDWMRMREALGITKKDGARYDAMEAHFHGYIFDKEHWQRTFGPVKKASYGVQSLLDNRHELETYAMAAADARQEAETARQEAETARQEAETARQEAETARQEAETARQEAETARQESRLKTMALLKSMEQLRLDHEQEIQEQNQLYESRLDEKQDEMEKLMGHHLTVIEHRDKARGQLWAAQRELAETENRYRSMYTAGIAQFTAEYAVAHQMGGKQHLRLAMLAVYRRILPQGARSGIKAFIFTLFRPIFKNKPLYQQWQLSRKTGQDALPDTLPVAIEANQAALAAEMQAIATAPQPLPAELLRLAEKDYIRQILTVPEKGWRSNDFKEKNENISTDGIDIRALAFYLPQFHAFPENDAWWGEGFTEWTNVTKATPLYPGHNQPRLPHDIGFYDLSQKKAIAKQQELAKLYGIHGFVIYYYWFAGKKLMDTPLNIILENPDLDLPFCLSWANENWTRRWDGLNEEVLQRQDYSPETMLDFARDLLPAMRDKRYIRVNGKPLLIIYNPAEIPGFDRTVSEWRAFFRAEGIGEIHLLVVLRSDWFSDDEAVVDGYVQFPPHSTFMDGNQITSMELGGDDVAMRPFEGCTYDYRDIVKQKLYVGETPYKLYRGVTMGWDNTARRGPKATIFKNFSPALFGEYMRDVVRFTDAHFKGDDKIIFINAWNEWAEGTYLEPDRKYGYACLEAANHALRRITPAQKPRIIFVCHDISIPAGAQRRSLNILRTLKEIFGYDVYLICGSGGELEDACRQYVKDMVIVDRELENLRQLAPITARWGASKAICNSVVSGDILAELSREGISCISLIHEMEGLVKSTGSVHRLAAINRDAVRLVFPSDWVRKSDEKLMPLDERKVVIRPQGLYKLPDFEISRDQARKDILERLDLPTSAQIIIGVGSVNKSKGYDLFADCALKVSRVQQNVHFVWLGFLDPARLDTVVETKPEIAAILESKHLIRLSPQSEIYEWYAASDLFLLTSREDSFPSVVLEALAVGTPVLAFENSGGFADIVTPENGQLVPRENTDSLADAVLCHLANPGMIKGKGEAGRRMVEDRFNFNNYVRDLLGMLEEAPVTVSAIVPNYNYARYLPDRLDSILHQSWGVGEIIVLDDASSDESVEILKKYRRLHPHRIKLILNEKNSGNVFAQWEKGLKAATGDFVWIAEADDGSEPDFVKESMLRFLQDDKVSMTFAQSKQMDENNNHLADDFLHYVEKAGTMDFNQDFVVDGREYIVQALSIKNTVLNVSSVMFRNKDFSSELALAREYKVAGDWQFYVRLLEEGGRFSYIRQPLNRHRIHQNSASHSLNNRRHYDEVVQMQKYVAERFPPGADEEELRVFRADLRSYLGVQEDD